MKMFQLRESSDLVALLVTPRTLKARTFSLHWAAMSHAIKPPRLEKLARFKLTRHVRDPCHDRGRGRAH